MHHTDQTAIAIPRSLLPVDPRFGAGPSKVRRESLAAIATDHEHLIGTSHRQQPVEALVGRVRDGLRTLLELHESYCVALGNGGPSTFWDIAVQGLIRTRSAHFTCGEWGDRFLDIARSAPHLEPPVVVRAAPGTASEPVEVDGVDARCVTHCETSTGVLTPLAAHGDEDTIVIIDATSSAGAVPVAAGEYDAFFFGPQKCFGAEAGMWLAILSPAAIARAEQIRSAGRWSPRSLDLRLALEKSHHNQTSNTPSVTALLMLERQINWMLEKGGVPAMYAKVRHSSSVVYDWAEASDYCWPFVSNASERSPVVAVVELQRDVSASGVCEQLRANGILDLEARPSCGDNHLRIGTFPNVDAGDVEALTACVDYVVERISA